ncbi:hypothetical protein GCM10010254_50370 [Streptomyces chromofuscus]|nr:hypothetical protein GCM10010254_50370 [Streptomyces chromofuscus]
MSPSAVRVTAVDTYDIRTARACLPHRPASSPAAIVNTCSVTATAGPPRRARYSVTKGAMYSLTLAMAADHVRGGIRVTCDNPGTADTPWTSRLLDVTAAEVAHTTACLASPMSGATTGTAPAVDGGMRGPRPRPADPR